MVVVRLSLFGWSTRTGTSIKKMKENSRNPVGDLAHPVVYSFHSPGWVSPGGKTCISTLLMGFNFEQKSKNKRLSVESDGSSVVEIVEAGELSTTLIFSRVMDLCARLSIKNRAAVKGFI